MNNITVNMENLSADEREQLMKLIEKVNKVEDKVWKPKDGELYYYIRFDGCIDYAIWNNDEYDVVIYSIGNCFRTEEEAEFTVERLKVIAEMKRIAAKDDEVEWDGKNPHYYIFFNFYRNEIGICWDCMSKASNIYFASKERTQEAIDTIREDRIKKYLFEAEV